MRGNIHRRLEDLEEQAGCPACRNVPAGTRAFYPEAGESEPQVECCPECGRPLEVVIRVQYAGGGVGS